MTARRHAKKPKTLIDVFAADDRKRGAAASPTVLGAKPDETFEYKIINQGDGPRDVREERLNALGRQGYRAVYFAASEVVFERCVRAGNR